MIKIAWSELFESWHEAKMIVLEWDNERRGKYESDKVWDHIIQSIHNNEAAAIPDNLKIQYLMRTCNVHMLFPTSQVVKRDRLVNMISATRDKINYYKNNPEEEE